MENPNEISEQREESLNNPTSEAKVVGTLSSPTKTDDEEEKVLSSLGSHRHIDSTLEGPPNLAKEKITHDPSNVQTPNLQTHSKENQPLPTAIKEAYACFNLLQLSICDVSKTQPS